MKYPVSVFPLAERLVKERKNVAFGVQPTEHMFVAEYKARAWQDGRVVPFENLTLSPLALCLHYGQTVFEGMKAFYMNDGRINIFRPEKHYERFARSLERMCMPVVPKELFMDALHLLVELDTDWVPKEEDGSLYLRPFMIATEERIGVKVSDNYQFLIVATPAYQYYTKPVKVKVETTYVRAAEGGTGYAKCGGNYGVAFYPTERAREAGYDQVLWTDSHDHEYIEESGTMNIAFIMDNTLITPPLSGTILDGVTRDSVLTIAREMGLNVTERRISYHEIQKALEDGRKVEAFGTGTAAVIAPIEIIGIDETDYQCYTESDALMYKLQHELLNIRKGLAPDKHGWNFIV